MTSEFSDKILVPGVIYGVRDFNWRKKKLQGVIYPIEYEPGVNKFKCVGVYSCHNQSKSLYKFCTCGFYAYFSNTPRNARHTGDVTGIIRATGKCIVGSKGFRAENAEVVAIIKGKKPKYSFIKEFPAFAHQIKRNILLYFIVMLAGMPQIIVNVLPEISTTLAIVAGAIYFPFLFAVMIFEDEDDDRKYLTRYTVRQITKQYPGIKVYETLKQAYVDFPADKPSFLEQKDDS